MQARLVDRGDDFAEQHVHLTTPLVDDGVNAEHLHQRQTTTAPKRSSGDEGDPGGNQEVHGFTSTKTWLACSNSASFTLRVYAGSTSGPLCFNSVN